MVAGVLGACAGAAGLSCAWFAAEVAAEFDVAGFDCANIAATAKASAAAINTARIQVIGLTCLSSDEPADSRLHGRTPHFATGTAMFHAGAALNPTNHASQFGLVFYLIESLDVLSDRLGLAVVQASDALVVRRLTP